MPRISKRKRLLKSLENFVFYSAAASVICGDSSSSESSESDSDESDSTSNDSSSSSSSDEDIADAISLRIFLGRNRYLGERTPVPKSSHLLDMILNSFDEQRFKQNARMSREAFQRILKMIESHDVFKVKYHKRKQTPPERQLIAALMRFGSSGNGSSVKAISQRCGISEGALDKFTNRVMVAILSLESSEVFWPQAEERAEISSRIEEESGFPNCLGFVDGTHIILDRKPSLNGEDYFNRKSSYSISTMIVCDDRRKIRYVHAGFCGSAHDSRVLKASKLASNSKDYFTEGEYLLADSGYASTETVIAAYKRPASLSANNAAFNLQLSHIRVIVEHTNGMLKGRFQSLRGLRIMINNRKDHQRAVYWIRTCCVLHNLLTADLYDESWTIPDGVEMEMSGNGAEEPVNNLEKGKAKREFVKEIVLRNINALRD